MKRNLTGMFGVSPIVLENLYSIGVTEVVINKVTAEMLMAGVPLHERREKLKELETSIGDGFKITIALE